MATNKILIIVTSAREYEKVGFRTGLWLGELTHFYDVAEQAGFEPTIASIDGGHVPIDPESLAQDVLAELGTDQALRRPAVHEQHRAKPRQRQGRRRRGLQPTALITGPPHPPHPDCLAGRGWVGTPQPTPMSVPGTSSAMSSPIRRWASRTKSS